VLDIGGRHNFKRFAIYIYTHIFKKYLPTREKTLTNLKFPKMGCIQYTYLESSYTYNSFVLVPKCAFNYVLKYYVTVL